MAYKTYDTYTTSDGTKYVGMYSDNRTQIYKEDADGNRTILSSTKGGRRTSAQRKKVSEDFDSFIGAVKKAETGVELTYTDEDVTAGGGGFLKKDKASTLTFSDGTVLSSKAGRTSNEVATLKRLADEIGAVSKANLVEEEQVDTNVDTNVDSSTRLEGADNVVNQDVIEVTGNVEFGDTDAQNAAEDALGEVGQGAAAAFGGSEVGDTTQNTSSFTDTSILGSGGGGGSVNVSNTADSGQAEKDASISVGPAEDDAIDFYTEGQRSTIMTSASGLLTDEEDPALRRRRSLLAG